MVDVAKGKAAKLAELVAESYQANVADRFTKASSSPAEALNRMISTLERLEENSGVVVNPLDTVKHNLRELRDVLANAEKQLMQRGRLGELSIVDLENVSGRVNSATLLSDDRPDSPMQNVLGMVSTIIEKLHAVQESHPHAVIAEQLARDLKAFRKGLDIADPEEARRNGYQPDTQSRINHLNRLKKERDKDKLPIATAAWHL